MTGNPVIMAWRGEKTLWTVFWLYGVALSTVLFAIVLAAHLAHAPVAAFALLLLLFLGYTAWILVSVWRSAFNVGEERYGHLARALTVVWAINAVLVSFFLLLYHLS